MTKEEQIARVFSNMTAYGYSWDVLWEAAVAQSGGYVSEAFSILSEGCTKQEIRCINAAFKKAGLAYQLI